MINDNILKGSHVITLHRFLSLQNLHLMLELGVLVTCHLKSWFFDLSELHFQVFDQIHHCHL